MMIKTKSKTVRKGDGTGEGKLMVMFAFPNRPVSVRVFTHHCFILHKYYTYSLDIIQFLIKKIKEKPPTDAAKLTKTNL